MNIVTQYLHGVLIGLDQLGNTLAFGDPDETISSRLGRLKVRHGGRIPWHHPIAHLIDTGLELIDPGHSVDSIEPHKSRRRRRRGPIMIICLRCRRTSFAPTNHCAQHSERYITHCENCNCLTLHEVFQM